MGNPVWEGPSSDSLPREEILRDKREHICVDMKNHTRFPSFDNATHLTDSLNNNPMKVLIMHCHSVDTTLNNPYWVSGWEKPLQNAVRLNMGRSMSSETRYLSRHMCSILRHTLVNGTSGPNVLLSFLREINLHFLGDISSSNLAERIRALDVAVGSTFDVHYIRLCVPLSDVGAAPKTKKEGDLNHSCSLRD